MSDINPQYPSSNPVAADVQPDAFVAAARLLAENALAIVDRQLVTEFAGTGKRGLLMCGECLQASKFGNGHLATCVVGAVERLANAVLAIPAGEDSPERSSAGAAGADASRAGGGRPGDAGEAGFNGPICVCGHDKGDHAYPNERGAGRGCLGCSCIEYRPHSVCPHCGPDCIPGAAHNARAEDGVFFEAAQVESDSAQGEYGEPWKVAEGDSFVTSEVFSAAGDLLIDPNGSDLSEEQDRRHSERIIACVNFCRGLSNEQLRDVELRLASFDRLWPVRTFAPATESVQAN